MKHAIVNIRIKGHGVTALAVAASLVGWGAVQAEPTHTDARGAGIRAAQAGEFSIPSTSTRLTLDNGLTVTIVEADELAARVEMRGSETIIPLDATRYLSVITDISDPAIFNKGDGSFHVFHRGMVVQTLRQISIPAMRMELTVYILPYPRRNILVSSTSGDEVFLSPHVLDIDPAVSAYIVAHELGHVFHNAYLPEGAPRWGEYRRVRGIEDPVRFSETASHAYRPREIFAEDFRVLFGGVEAAYGGNVENSEIATPTSVRGLNSFLASLTEGASRVGTRIVATNYPNPFNPETEIRFTVPGGGAQHVRVNVYDVRGSLVRSLYDRTASDEVSIHWDGLDNLGNRVASSTYYADIRMGAVKTTLKLVMLK